MSTLLDKVLAIHHLHLPYDVVNHINSFRFYDQKQVQILNQKRSIIRKIERSFNGHDLRGHWWFCAGFYTIDNNEDQPFEIQFQASNCKRCGNYIHGNNLATASSNCLCTCFLGQHYYPATTIADNQDDTEVDDYPLIMHM